MVLLMTRPRLRFVVALAVAGVALMATRPGNEYQLFIQLNGQPMRWRLPDAGQSGIFTTFDAGAGNASGCMTLRGGVVRGPGDGAPWAFTPSTVVIVASTPINLCVRPSAQAPYWDGGCSTSDTDENFGVPLQPNVPQYVTVDTNATAICAASDAGFILAPIFGVQ